MTFSIKSYLVKRLTTVIGNKKNYQIISTIKGSNAIALDAEQAALVEGVFGKTFRIYSNSGIDIKAGDILVDGTKEYLVKGFNDFDFGIRHSEILVEETIKQ